MAVGTRPESPGAYRRRALVRPAGAQEGGRGRRSARPRCACSRSRGTRRRPSSRSPRPPRSRRERSSATSPPRKTSCSWDEYDPLARGDLLASCPLRSAAGRRRSARSAIEYAQRPLSQDPVRLLSRVRLDFDRAGAACAHPGRADPRRRTAAPALARGASVETTPTSCSVRVVGSAMLGAVSVALDHWQEERRQERSARRPRRGDSTRWPAAMRELSSRSRDAAIVVRLRQAGRSSVSDAADGTIVTSH